MGIGNDWMGSRRPSFDVEHIVWAYELGPEHMIANGMHGDTKRVLI